MLRSSLYAIITTDKGVIYKMDELKPDHPVPGRPAKAGWTNLPHHYKPTRNIAVYKYRVQICIKKAIVAGKMTIKITQQQQL